MESGNSQERCAQEQESHISERNLFVRELEIAENNALVSYLHHMRKGTCEDITCTWEEPERALSFTIAFRLPKVGGMAITGQDSKKILSKTVEEVVQVQVGRRVFSFGPRHLPASQAAFQRRLLRDDKIRHALTQR